MMAESKSRRLTFVLGVIAALLAWAAAMIRYVRTGEVALWLLAAGLFCLVLAMSSRGTSSTRR
jgi:hypothetical protein